MYQTNGKCPLFYPYTKWKQNKLRIIEESSLYETPDIKFTIKLYLTK